MFSIITPDNTSVSLLKRRPYQKSRKGCVTCKQRKLKCDEIKPVCGNCLRRFVNIEACDYGEGAVFEQGSVVRDTARLQNVHVREASIARSPSPILPASISNELLDPFASHPETRVKDVNVLMKYYLSKGVYRYYPWQPPSATNPTTTFYVPLVWNDPVLFHVILQLSCLRLEKEKKYEEVTKNEGRLMMESIQLLRTRVEEEHGVSDQTIGAVATLAAIEHEKGNMARLRMHMSGLKRMISLRGGLQAIRQNNPMVANLVFWVCVVTIYETPFPCLDPVLPPFYPGQHNLAFSFSDLSSQQLDPSPLSGIANWLWKPIYSVLISVQHVSQLVPTSSSYSSANTNLVILTRLMTLLSHLMSLPAIGESQMDEYHRMLSESARYGVLLHVFTPWRGLPPDGSLAINNLLHRLMSFLRSLSYITPPTVYDLGTEKQSKILRFWVTAVGGVAALGTSERVWFVGQLGLLCNEMEVQEWEDWREIVSRVVWHEALCAPLHKKLWGEVAEFRTRERAREE